MSGRRRAAQQRAASRKRGRRWLAAAGGAVALVAVGLLLLRPAALGVQTEPAVPYTTPVLGDAHAPVTIVEYGDFQCPSCGAFARSIEPELVKRYVDTGKAKLVFKNFPWIGNESKVAAQAAACAGAQGKFWPYHDQLYAHQRGENSGFFTVASLKAFASTLQLDRAAFDACLDGGSYRDAVDRDFSEVRGLGLNGTPTFIINGQRIVGAQPVSVFAQVIDAKLAGR